MSTQETFPELVAQYLQSCSQEDIDLISKFLLRHGGSTQSLKDSCNVKTVPESDKAKHEIQKTIDVVAAPVVRIKSDMMKAAKVMKQSQTAKRPLNSWMAFRTYYSPIFVKVQQKNISGLLKMMWQADHFHGKWTVLAKAYSKIRDFCGKQNAPLSRFLDLACPELGIIAPVDYCSVCNWEIKVVPEGHIELIKKANENLELLSHNLYPGMVSVEDILALWNQRYGEEVNNSSFGSIGVHFSSSFASGGTFQDIKRHEDFTQPWSQCNASIGSTKSMVPGTLSSDYDFTQSFGNKSHQIVLNNDDLEDISGQVNQSHHGSSGIINQSHGPYSTTLLELEGHPEWVSRNEFSFDSMFDPSIDTSLIWDPACEDPFDAYDISTLPNGNLGSADFENTNFLSSTDLEEL